VAQIQWGTEGMCWYCGTCEKEDLPDADPVVAEHFSGHRPDCRLARVLGAATASPRRA
jgi:hypothetical protein